MASADFNQSPASLYPELDATALTAYATALETGEPGGLSPARAAEIDAFRSVAVFSRGKVTGADGDLLDAALWRHTGPEPRPVIVMPSPWTDLGWITYAVQATLFAARGYDVLAYTARGFGASQGEVEVAGPLDVADGSRALDHLVERTAGPVTGVGFLGDSYGSGISQLVAAHDTRVDAVVALSTWGDLGEVFYENSTRHTAAVQALLGAAARARLSPQTESVFENVLANRDIAGTLRWAEQRSPLHHVKELNRRQVPVFFSHAWHETLFPGNQTLKTFNELTGPKRLALSVGDHAGPEMSGMLGLPNRIWTDAHRWFDHHLRGIDTGIADEGQVLSEIMWSRALEPRPGWHSLTEGIRRLYLGDDGELTGKPEAGWSARVLCGVDTPATVADAIVRSGYAEMAGRPKSYPARDIDRTVTAVWATPPVEEITRLRGVPRLRVTYRAANPGSSFVAYLFDQAPDGSARIVTHAPYTDLGPEADRLISADFELQATAYDIPRGHRLLLVFDALDPFYGDANLPRATLSFTSPEATPSCLDLPLGG
ncbi:MULTISPECIES: CocE/NonD family hydrolase [unclassified Streptomyces]|uniref:CocE/NonD family hydrolase n=1 Tax=unclassified Streptomyces TaxID=2593676 RepID=UPI00224CBC15|nr:MULTISPECIES: CocE/NonD family hydrolase [unclassified Streptomyces]MCX4526489.1 alpha/beta hydrolase [Streptomyces sp. NBC_01551]MCX4542948.1 alpha/beta hydrolase [Streptomyces sp. NBC_01565]